MRQFQAVSRGPEARILPGGPGRVLAVLRTAVYLESHTGYVIGLVDGAAPDGPLAVRVSGFGALHAALTAAPPGRVTFTAAGVALGDQTWLSWMDAPYWMPPSPPRGGSRAAQAEATAALAALIRQHPPATGLAGLVTWLPRIAGYTRNESGLPTSAGPLLGAAAPLILRWHAAWQAGDGATAAQALSALLGLGPGLTPSGDDLVMGLLGGLVWRYAPDPAAPSTSGTQAGPTIDPGLLDGLIAAVRPAAAARTNRISTRLIWHAGAGVLYAPAMALAAALRAGDAVAVEARSGPLFAIGATSGVDLAVGLWLANAAIGAV